MVTLSSTQRYYLWREPVDMRKSFDGLQGLVTGHIGRDALSGEVFIFMNRRRDQVKLLVWDRLLLKSATKRIKCAISPAFSSG